MSGFSVRAMSGFNRVYIVSWDVATLSDKSCILFIFIFVCVRSGFKWGNIWVLYHSDDHSIF